MEYGVIKLTIAADLAGIQGIGLEYGEFRRVGPLSSGSHIGGGVSSVRVGQEKSV